MRILLVLLSFALTACASTAPVVDSVESPDVQAANSARTTAKNGFGPEISAEDFAAHVKVLASDEFAGRAPGTIGETKTVEYLVQQAKRLGLKPGNGDSYTQRVAMSVINSKASPMRITQNGKTRELSFATDMVIGSRREQAAINIDNSEMVFVGYGVNAPEVGWNDYAGLNVKGKTVVMLINDPGFHANDASLFEGRRMTYYGRWTYKFEEAARQGAAAALIIHDTDGAAYGWDVVKNSWSGEQYDLPQASDPEARLPIQGWITAERTNELFGAAKLDFMKLRAAANKKGFKAVPLKARMSVGLQNNVRFAESQNVIAKVEGAEKPNEAVFYTAHWDHLGIKPDEPGDNIYNGAIDNATGVAGLLEIAEQFTVQNPAPKRSVYFLFVTLEESGLLGSKYYAANPVLPLSDTVAVINIDAMLPIGETRDMTVVGLGNSELDDILRPIAAKQNRVLVEESAPEKGFFFRSDHFSFAKKGVPALYAKGGTDHIEKGTAHVQAIAEQYNKVQYHRAADNFDPNWDLRGAVYDLRALYQVGRELSSGNAWPNYVKGNAFRLREKTASASQ
jgi:Zn-dependent M28 family amino/carboxypeptidase